MKLRNKETGEIALFENAVDIHDRLVVSTKLGFVYYNSLAELNEDWEDYEEPKEDYKKVIDTIVRYVEESSSYWACDESVKKFVEKLKAWRRLKDKGFKFDEYIVAHNSNGDLCGQAFYKAGDYCIEDVEKDLDLLFGGEDE